MHKNLWDPQDRCDLSCILIYFSCWKSLSRYLSWHGDECTDRNIPYKAVDSAIDIVDGTTWFHNGSNPRPLTELAPISSLYGLQKSVIKSQTEHSKGNTPCLFWGGGGGGGGYTYTTIRSTRRIVSITLFTVLFSSNHFLIHIQYGISSQFHSQFTTTV